MIVKLFLLYWYACKSWRLAIEQLPHDTVFFYFALFSSVIIISLVINSWKDFLPPIAVTILSLIGICWFVFTAYLDGKGTFSPIIWINVWYVFIDILSLFFCWEQLKGNSVGVYIVNRIRWVNNLPILLYKKVNNYISDI